jgi:hypothetical protein
MALNESSWSAFLNCCTLDEIKYAMAPVRVIPCAATTNECFLVFSKAVSGASIETLSSPFAALTRETVTFALLVN